MSYLALYRRFRPQKFEDLIGQETIVRSLVNQINTDKIGHAYLFCGARGTGKTTAAKIFARAINCTDIEKSPCGKCETCLALKDANSLDIIEIDAASNNKVEHAREIREKVQYPPVNGRFKVYIVDEVHMLSTEAFNALLKTIEEPPNHVVFILATTEPHKLPATILSRCMRFDFKLVSVEKLAQLIASIYDKIEKKYTDESIIAIARAGEGSVRDALSIADICLSYNNEMLTYKDVIDVLGASDRTKTAELVEAIFTGNVGVSLAMIDELSGLGKNTGMLIRDILMFLREIMVVKTCSYPEKILSLPVEEIECLKQIAEKTDNHALLRRVEIFSEIENVVKYSTQPKIVLETAIVKSSTASSDYNIDALISRITKLEVALENGSSENVNVEVKTNNNSSSSFNSSKIDAIASRLERLEKTFDELRTDIINCEKQIKQQRITERQNAPITALYPDIPSQKKLNDSLDAIDATQLTLKTDGLPKENNLLTANGIGRSRQDRLMRELGGIAIEFPVQDGVGEKDVLEDSLLPPPEDSEAYEEGFSELKKQSVKKSVELKQGEHSAGSIPDKRLWGTLIKRLRESNNIMLWVIVQELSATVSADELIIHASTETEYQTLMKESNVTTLKGFLAEISNYKLKISKADRQSENFDDDVELIKSEFPEIDID